MAWRVMTEKKHSTRLIHERPVGVKCKGDPVVLGPGEPLAGVGVLVGGVVVTHHVQLGVRVGGGDLFVELEELLVAVAVAGAGVAGIGDLAGGGVQGGEQAGHAVPGVVMGLPFGDALPHQQDWLCPFQRLALRFLIHADHDRVPGWVQVEADDDLPAAPARPGHHPAPSVSAPDLACVIVPRFRGNIKRHASDH
jgi:hypothetical protein